MHSRVLKLLSCFYLSAASPHLVSLQNRHLLICLHPGWLPNTAQLCLYSSSSSSSSSTTAKTLTASCSLGESEPTDGWTGQCFQMNQKRWKWRQKQVPLSLQGTQSDPSWLWHKATHRCTEQQAAMAPNSMGWRSSLKEGRVTEAAVPAHRTEPPTSEQVHCKPASNSS